MKSGFYLAEIVKHFKRRIKKAEYDGALPVVSKIVFKTGEIIFRKERKTGMDLLKESLFGLSIKASTTQKKA